MLFAENPLYKEAYYEFPEIHKKNHGNKSTAKQLEEFEKYFAMDFMHFAELDEDISLWAGLTVRLEDCEIQ